MGFVKADGKYIDDIYGIVINGNEPSCFFTSWNEAIEYWDYLDDPEVEIIKYSTTIFYKRIEKVYPHED